MSQIGTLQFSSVAQSCPTLRPHGLHHAKGVKKGMKDFLGGQVVKTSCSQCTNAVGMDLITSLETKIPHATGCGQEKERERRELKQL